MIFVILWSTKNNCTQSNWMDMSHTNTYTDTKLNRRSVLTLMSLEFLLFEVPSMTFGSDWQTQQLFQLQNCHTHTHIYTLTTYKSCVLVSFEKEKICANVNEYVNVIQIIPHSSDFTWNSVSTNEWTKNGKKMMKLFKNFEYFCDRH